MTPSPEIEPGPHWWEASASPGVSKNEDPKTKTEDRRPYGLKRRPHGLKRRPRGLKRRPMI